MKILVWALFFYFPVFSALADEPLAKPSARVYLDKEGRVVERHVPITPRTIEHLPPPSPLTHGKQEPAIAALPQPVLPGAPSLLTSCDPGGCWDSHGKRYNSGGANTYLNQSGRPCNRNGIWVQCF
jgi:hypothetical protein